MKTIKKYQIKKFTFSLIFASVVIVVAVLIYEQQKTILPAVDVDSSRRTSIAFFPDTLIHLGNVREKESVDIEFAFENKGNESLIIDDVITNCGCMASAWPRKPILPKEKDIIKISFHAKSIGFFSKNATIFLNNTNGPVILYFEGNVVGADKKP